MAELDIPRPDIEEFSSRLVDDAVDEIRGSHLSNGDRVAPETIPRTRFFAGAIVPEDPDPSMEETIRSRVSPSLIGIIGDLSPKDGTVEFEVGVSFSLYYRAVPHPDDLSGRDEIPRVFKKREIGPVFETVSIPVNRSDSGFEAGDRR